MVSRIHTTMEDKHLGRNGYASECLSSRRAVCFWEMPFQMSVDMTIVFERARKQTRRANRC